MAKALNGESDSEDVNGEEKPMSQNNGHTTSLRLKTGLAEMLKGGVIMDVTTASRLKLHNRLVPSRSWHWSVCLLKFARRAASPAWRRRK